VALYPNAKKRQADTGVQPVTKRYTNPYSAFRQVFALGASEGAATTRRIEVLGVLVNGTVVLGKRRRNIGFLLYASLDTTGHFDGQAELALSTFRVPNSLDFAGILDDFRTDFAVKSLWKKR
jgi:hypothetical protein